MPPSASPSLSTSPTTTTPSHPRPSTSTKPPRTSRKPRTTLYDATTSRLTSYTSLLASSAHSHNPALQSDTLSHSTLRALTPSEALFEHHRGAPERFEEVDVYDAVCGLPAGARGEGVLRKGMVDWEKNTVVWDRDEQREEREREGMMMLPSSELLEAVHAYTSDFYGALGRSASSSRRKERAGKKKSRRDDDDESAGSRWDFGSMDETALLAFGILLEESVREALGEEGDMVFVEGEAQDLDEYEDAAGRSRSRSRSKSRGVLVGGLVDAQSPAEEGSVPVPVQRKQGKGKKRVRIVEGSGTDEEAEGRMDRRKKKRRRTVFEGEEDY